MSPSLLSDTVTSTLDFFFKTYDGQFPFARLFDDGTGQPSMNYELKEEAVKIENIRGKEQLYTLDTSGFQFIKWDTDHITFASIEELERQYIPEAVEFVRKLTGAIRVVPFEPVIRRHSRQPDYTKPQAVKFAHIDQTTHGAIARARQFVPAEEVDDLLKGRFQVINLWRPIGHAALDRPLAVCDYRSIEPDKDLIPFRLIYRDRVGEPYLMKYNPRHDWKYLRGMDVNEVLLFKCYDSLDEPGIAKFSGHASFEDPTAPPQAPSRKSVEVRMLVFYGE